MRVIAGASHGRRLVAPRGWDTRPATARVRASIFSRVASRLKIAQSRVLDLFAGSGSLGIEALSRGAARVTFVDSSREAAAAIRANLAKIGLGERGRIILADIGRALNELGGAHESFDLAFVDAPFKDDTSNSVVELLARLELIANDGWIVVEQSKRAPDAPPVPPGFARTAVAIIGDHRLAFYQRSADLLAVPEKSREGD